MLFTFFCDSRINLKTENLWTRYATNLVPKVFFSYCAGLMKRATLQSSFSGSILISIKSSTNGRKKNSKEFVGHSFESGACVINSTGRPILRTSNRIILSSSLLIIGREKSDPGYEGNMHPPTKKHATCAGKRITCAMPRKPR